MQDDSKLDALMEEYINVAVQTTRVYEAGGDCLIFESWLNTCIEGILVLKNAS